MKDISCRWLLDRDCPNFKHGVLILIFLKLKYATEIWSVQFRSNDHWHADCVQLLTNNKPEFGELLTFRVHCLKDLHIALEFLRSFKAYIKKRVSFFYKYFQN
jgi:hypothetical protein